MKLVCVVVGEGRIQGGIRFQLGGCGGGSHQGGMRHANFRLLALPVGGRGDMQLSGYQLCLIVLRTTVPTRFTMPQHSIACVQQTAAGVVSMYQQLQTRGDLAVTSPDAAAPCRSAAAASPNRARCALCSSTTWMLELVAWVTPHSTPSTTRW
jgi:hypothetical protein